MICTQVLQHVGSGCAAVTRDQVVELFDSREPCSNCGFDSAAASTLESVTVSTGLPRAVTKARNKSATRRHNAVFRLARTDSGLLVSFALSRFGGSTAAAPLPKRSIFMGLQYSGPVPDLRSVAEADWSAEHFPS